MSDSSNGLRINMEPEMRLSTESGQYGNWVHDFCNALAPLGGTYLPLVQYLRDGSGLTTPQAQTSTATKQMCQLLWPIIARDTVTADMMRRLNRDDAIRDALLQPFTAPVLKTLLFETIPQVIRATWSTPTVLEKAKKAFQNVRGSPSEDAFTVAEKIYYHVRRMRFLGIEPPAYEQVEQFFEALPRNAYYGLHEDVKRKLIVCHTVDEAAKIADDRWIGEQVTRKPLPRPHQVNAVDEKERERKRERRDTSAQSWDALKTNYDKLEAKFDQLTVALLNGGFANTQRHSKPRPTPPQDRVIGNRPRSDGRCRGCNAFGHWVTDTKPDNTPVCPSRSNTKWGQAKKPFKRNKRPQKN